MKPSLVFARLAVMCAALAGLLSACSSVGGDGSPSDWIEPVHTQRASFLWRHPGGTVAGEALITYDISGNVLIRLTKGLPRPVLEVVSTSTGEFSASGPFAGRGWSGPASRVPLRHALWQALAEAWRGAIPARDGRQEVHAASYRAAVWKDGGKIRELAVSSTDNGELIRLVFGS